MISRIPAQPPEREFRFYFRTEQAWDAIFADCLAAFRSINVEQYILEADAAGERFLRLFAQKAREGIAVRLLLDAVGCRHLHTHPLIDDIRLAGGEVHFYHDLGLRSIPFPSSWLPRTHVKTVIIDARIAYTGSVCFQESMRDWHDLQVRFEGPAVHQANEAQAQIWTRLMERRRLPQMHCPAGAIRYVVSEPRVGMSTIYQELLERIYHARHRIRIVTPYFIPPRRLRKALERASARGVSVEILTSKATDVPLADWAARTYFKPLLGCGIKIFLFDLGVLHAKYVIVDDEWVTVGSVNIDYLSLTKNREASLVMTEKNAVAELWRCSSEYALKSIGAKIDILDDMPCVQRWIGRLIRLMVEAL